MTRSTASAAADVRATILLSGVLRDPSNTTADPPSTTTTTIYDLLNWQPTAGNPNAAKLTATVDEILADSKGNKKIRTEHPLFEASNVILAQYFQAGMTVRNELFWKSNRKTSSVTASSRRSNVGLGYG